MASTQEAMMSAQAGPGPTSPTLQTTSDGLASASTLRPSSTQQQPLCYTSNSTSQFSSSPRQLPSDLPDAILEEGADHESGSDSPNDIEPLTPTSQNSQEFKDVNTVQDDFKYLPQYDYSRPNQNSIAHPISPQKTPLPSRQPTDQAVWRPAQPQDPVSTPATETEPEPPSLSRRSTRSSTTSFKRTMSSLFRRSTSNVAVNQQVNGTTTPPASNPATSTNGIALRQNPSTQDPAKRRTAPTSNGPPPTRTAPTNGSRRFSFTRSATTTRSNTPPSPGSPLEPSQTNPGPTSTPNGSLPAESAFDQKKKNRSSTGLSLRGRTIGFLSTPRGGPGAQRGRRASSFDSERADSKTRKSKNDKEYELERSNWALSPEAGTGAKARRMSLSLPDDFTVDVAELSSEYEYQSKFLGRHGKHLGKGAASKVTLMARKGCPEELYAVKEFRGKSGRESKEDYEKKIKSEFSIAKSLHHPNIIETIRLCTDHSRWNHVMEYCSEGDLFSLVRKGYLKDEKHKKDRMCLFKQLIQGVNYLHENGIAHRDIKLENLLMTKDSKLKITDFGVSEVFSGTHPGLRESGGQCGKNMGEVRLCSPGICGSEPYIAPEVLAKEGKYDPRPLDVWSTAIVMIYLTFGGGIWQRAAPGNEHYDALVRGWDKWYSKHDADATISDTDYPHHKAFDLMVSPPALRRVLLQMLNPDPKKRISINDVIENRWMKNVECCQLESYDDPSQVIDATKANANWKNGHKKIFCHSHLPAKSQGHSLGPMPGQPGY